MKITHYADYTRNTRGQFKKKSNKKKILWAIVIAIIIFLGVKSDWTMIDTGMGVNSQSEGVQSHIEGLTPEQQAQLERQYELAKEETILKNKKDKLDAEYKAKSGEIEAQLEAIRAEKLSFK